MLNIADYDITPERGYLTPHDMGAVALPDVFRPVVEAGRRLPGYITARNVHAPLRLVPEIDMDAQLPKLNDAQLRMLMVHYSFIVQSWVWGEDKAGSQLARNIAVPYCKLADRMGQFPLLPYSSYTLDNWAKIDLKGGVTLDNIRVIQNFAGGQDENWFILVHVEIEAQAGKALAAIPALLESAGKGDAPAVLKQLNIIEAAWVKCCATFDRMPERCDPYIYYNRVRPYIHGWKGNPALPDGVLYEGVEKFHGKPQAFRGQTGSQSSIVPTMDALFGIAHVNDPLREYLDELHSYRPPKHRLFIEEVGKRSHLRDFIMKEKDIGLIRRYNACVALVERFRTRHLEYAANYINKQAASGDGNPVEVGTGGTPFMKYLKKHRDESHSHLLPESIAS
jgi:indoleamine 2,3-dioxygenase